jgi:predicted RNase H-like nuclease (RuvC/YqgF family)
MNFESLDLLEQRVKETAERLAELGQRNAELTARVSELEQELASARASAGGSWTQERDQLRSRVEKLAARLSEALEG